MVKFDIDKLTDILNSLKELPNIREVRQLRIRLKKEEQKFKVSKKLPKITKKVKSNRPAKLQRYWRYVKLIRDNFPKLKTNEIRKQLKQRRKGQDVSIPDAIWQNPSA